MSQPIFTGAGVAIVTPFHNDGSVNYEKLAELLEWHIANQTDAIIITGTTGESSTLDDDEHKEVIRFTVEKVAKRIPVIAGTGSNNTAYAIQLSQYSESVGVDGLLLVTPYYNKATQDGLVKHFTAIADSVNIPIILYNVPSRTGVNITPATCQKLSKHNNIVGIKEASSDISQIEEIAATCPDFHIYSGNDDQTLPILSLGGKGVISVLSNVMPKETHDICQYFFDGDVHKSLELQLKVHNINKALFCEVNPIPVKAALNLMGFDVGSLRMPLTEISAQGLEILKKSMVELDLI